jgi:hypothetical protein
LEGYAGGTCPSLSKERVIMLIILGPIVQNLVARGTWQPGAPDEGHPGIKNNLGLELRH